MNFLTKSMNTKTVPLNRWTSSMYLVTPPDISSIFALLIALALGVVPPACGFGIGPPPPTAGLTPGPPALPELVMTAAGALSLQMLIQNLMKFFRRYSLIISSLFEFRTDYDSEVLSISSCCSYSITLFSSMRLLHFILRSLGIICHSISRSLRTSQVRLIRSIGVPLKMRPKTHF